MCVEGREVGGQHMLSMLGHVTPRTRASDSCEPPNTGALEEQDHLSTFPPSRTFRKIGKSGIQNDGTHMKASTRERSIRHTLDLKTA